MSTKVKERLKKLALEMTHEERLVLDQILAAFALVNGLFLISKEKLGCDAAMDFITDEQLREIVNRIKKKKKKQVLVEAA